MCKCPSTKHRPGCAWAPVVVSFQLVGDAKEPTQGHPGEDAGWDIYTSEETFVIGGALRDIPTGLYVALPPGYWGHLVSRSSTPRKWDMHVESAVIDNGYRGEMFLCVRNLGFSRTIPKHTRLAQLILRKMVSAEWQRVESLPPSSRGPGGFGSTGA